MGFNNVAAAATAILAVMTTVAISAAVAEMGSCRAAKKCCDGKDADCVVQAVFGGAPPSAEDEDEAAANSVLDGEPCYCDHGCLEVGDCCPDFKDYCGGKSALFPTILNHNRNPTHFIPK